jgi:hypothetical protein
MEESKWGVCHLYFHILTFCVDVFVGRCRCLFWDSRMMLCMLIGVSMCVLWMDEVFIFHFSSIVYRHIEFPMKLKNTILEMAWCVLHVWKVSNNLAKVWKTWILKIPRNLLLCWNFHICTQKLCFSHIFCNFCLFFTYISILEIANRVF